MAVSTPTFAIIYTGNGSDSTAYAIPFPFFENAHIFAAVSADGVAESVTLDDSAYNVSRLDDGSGGSLLTAVAVTAPATITIWRKVPLTQPTEFQPAGPFPSKSAETALDRLEMQIQQIAGEGVAVPPAGGDTVADVLSWANDAARAAKKATRAGQLGVQLDNASVWRSMSTAAGDWKKAGEWRQEYQPVAPADVVVALDGEILTYLSEDTAIKSICLQFTGGGSDFDAYNFSLHAGDVLLAEMNLSTVPDGGFGGGGLWPCEIPDTIIPAGTTIFLTVDNVSSSPGGMGLLVVLNCARF